MVEYVIPCLERGLVDQSAYVRRNAIMGVLKVYHIEKERIRDSNLVTALQNLVLDTDALVVTNALLALKEITGDLPKTKALIHHLLNRLNDFNEWCMCIVLDLVSQYQPENETELFGIMNLLEPFLRYHNTAVILATTKVYLSFTENMPQVFQQVMSRLKQPLLTLMASNIPEVAYCVLAHMKLLLRKCKETFHDEFRQFYCRYNEPTFIQQMKIDILPMLATETNFVDILNELKEYVPGGEEVTSRAAIRAICQLGLSLGQRPHALLRDADRFLRHGRGLHPLRDDDRHAGHAAQAPRQRRGGHGARAAHPPQDRGPQRPRRLPVADRHLPRLLRRRAVHHRAADRRHRGAEEQLRASGTTHHRREALLPQSARGAGPCWAVCSRASARTTPRPIFWTACTCTTACS